MPEILQIEKLFSPEFFMDFVNYKKASSNTSTDEITLLESYISSDAFNKVKTLIANGRFPEEPSIKKIINKDGNTGKRIVYSFNSDTLIALKYIAYTLYQYDFLFSDNCYAFRRNKGVGTAIKRIKNNKSLPFKYCYKADIHNYFNSINTGYLLKKLQFINECDPLLYKIFENLLLEEYTFYNSKLIKESRGAMAGIPVSAFFANIYLSSMDQMFYEEDIDYFRYSDDIIVFAETREELELYKDRIYSHLKSVGLSINKNKESLSNPGETWEFLGFSYNSGIIDLSENTIRKMKRKIKRKAHALSRWQRKKGLSPDKAAKGFVNTMNRKFFGTPTNEISDNEPSELTWSRWFFPYLNTHNGLAVIDRYMQEYIRYLYTGRHYKGNYRISYQDLKQLGYRSLVHEFYCFKKNKILLY